MALATHCIPYDEECSICNPPTSQAVTPTDTMLEKLMDDGPFSELDPSYEELARDRYAAARAALVALYDRQREEIDEARKILAAALDRDESKWNESLRVLASLASNGIYWRSKEIASLSSQPEREQLTPEQAKHLRGVYTNIEESAGTCALCADINVVLRRLSQSDQ